MSINILELINKKINNFNSNNLFNSSIDFFKVLNYPMDTIQEEANYSLNDFLEMTGQEKNSHLKDNDIENIEILFNLSEDEMAKYQENFYKGKNTDIIIEAYLFLAIKLKDKNHSKTDIVSISKGINKCINAPAFILFNYDNKLTLSITDRRINKKDETRDVIEKTILIKDIDINKPHSAHIRILEGLEFGNLGNKQNFEYFHNSLKKVLNIKELNKKFYKELSNWYFWALEKVEFPDDEEENEEKRNSQNIIRFIIRFMFSWFLKEKGLIPEKVFDKDYIYNNIIENKDRERSTYYKTILQNLFFATLNTEMDNRGFVKSYKGTQSDGYGIHSLYRYSRFLKSKDENLIIDLFKDIPFLNGGLFECLDKIKTGKSDEIRVDMFSDNKRNEERLIFPDELLFGVEQDYDLNKVYYTKNKNYKVKGLINILNNYKFTVEENTPLEQDVALDPELLGEIFENLLASYNEETSTTARKQTGSFYTPREIVNYMVDSSIKEYLKTKNSDIDDLDNKLKKLFDINMLENPFNYNESEKLVKSINKMKIIDPACGSGAFPMGILNKTVKILEKLDPENQIWRLAKLDNLNKDSEDYKERERQIEETFDMTKNEANYARKLFLIKDCIYGVDIQPIAIQIAKLRFFVSLVIEQKVDKTKSNFGILTLPNLETKFVSANTLLSVEKPLQMQLGKNEYQIIEDELKKVRRECFEVRTHKTKKKKIIKDKELRGELKLALQKSGFKVEVSEKIANWNPYEQNKSADFFDPEFMFGEKEKFDIVIGNPPYIRHEKIKDLKPQLKNIYKTFTGTADIYIYFYEKGYNLLKENGILSYITSNKWTRAKYGKNFRKFLLKNTDLLSYVDFNGVKVFESATVDTSVMEFKKSNNNSDFVYCDIDRDYELNMNLDNYIEKNGFDYKKSDLDIEGFSFANPKELKIKKRIEEVGIPLKEWDIKITYGILTGFNEAFIIDGKTKDELIAKDPKCAEIIKPLLRGRDIKRYKYEFADKWLINSHNGYKNTPRIKVENDYPVVKEWLDSFKEQIEKRYDKGETAYNLRNCAYIDEFKKEKIMYQEMVQYSSFMFDKDKNFFCLDTGRIITGKNLKYLLSVFNSKLFFYSIKTFYGGGGLGENGVRMKHTFFENFSLKDIVDKYTFEILVDYIIHLKENSKYYENTDLFSADKLFERVIDFMVYGLYFEKEMKEDGTYINDELEKILNNIKCDDFEKLDDIKKEETIKKVRSEFKNNKIIMKALTFCNVEEIRIIEESVKNNEN